MNIDLKRVIKYSLILVFFIGMQSNIISSYLLYGGFFIYGITSLRRAISTIIYMFIISSFNANLVIQNPMSNIIKLGILLITFLYIIILQIKKKRILILKSTILIGIFIILNIISSIIFNINLGISIMKLISYCVGTYTLCNGIMLCKKYNWGEWIYYVLTSIIIVSIMTLLLGDKGFYIRNLNLFTGIWVHPNIYGAIVTISISYFLFFIHNKLQKNKLKFFNIGISASAYLTILLCKARMSIAVSSIIIIIFIFLFIRKYNKKKIIITIVVSILFVVIVLVNSIEINTSIRNIILKNGTEDILFSRRAQLNRVLDSFHDSPFIGKGFGVDDNINIDVSFGSAPVEKGNIIIAILSESGLIGLFLFIAYIITFIFENKNEISYGIIFVIVTILLTNLSEMTYFSMNNLGIINCFIMGLYLSLRDSNMLEGVE